MKKFTGTVTGLPPLALLLIVLGLAVIVTMAVMDKMSTAEREEYKRTGRDKLEPEKLDQRIKLLEERVIKLEDEVSKQRLVQQQLQQRRQEP